MKKTKTQKGITLVALIITIIVLLILAVVAIRAVQEDGIIQYAKNAKTDYQAAQANEAATLLEYSTKINEALNGSRVVNAPLELATYILGAEKKGRNLEEIIDLNTFVFKDDETTEVDESTAVTTLNVVEDETGKKGFVYIKYDNVAYKVEVKVNDSGIITSEYLSEIYTPQGREGITVQYDSNGDNTKEDWIIITDRDGKVEIVSANVMYDADGNGLTLGYKDAEIKGNLVKYLDLNGDNIQDDLDGDGSIKEGGTNETDWTDIAIASYNNAITRINNYCNSLVTSSDNVRSVGGTNNSVAAYSSTNFNSWFKGSATVASGDTQWEEDFVKLLYWEKAESDGDYWMASRFVEESKGYRTAFSVCCVRDGRLVNGWLVVSRMERARCFVVRIQLHGRASSCHKSIWDLISTRKIGLS